MADPSAKKYEIREATPDDLEQIYNIWVKGMSQALSVSGTLPDFRKDFKEIIEAQDQTFKIWVAEDSAKDSKGSSIVGWQALSPMINNPAVREFFAESRTYILTDVHDTGVAQALIKHALAHTKKTSLQHVLAFIETKNQGAIALAKSVGGVKVGKLPPSTKLPNEMSIFHYPLSPLPSGLPEK